MAGRVRRGRGSPFKRIIHCLWPANNISRKPAVPHSPNPSLERPSPRRDRRKAASAAFGTRSHGDKAGVGARVSSRREDLEGGKAWRGAGSSGDAVPRKSQVPLSDKDSICEQDEIPHSSSFLPHRVKQKGAPASELLHLRKQAEDLVNENDELKMIVRRLNLELSRYQSKFKRLSKEELNMKLLSPFLLDYEDRMKEKDELVATLEEEMRRLKTRVQGVEEENKELQQKLKSTVTMDTWTEVKAHLETVLEENELLRGHLKDQLKEVKGTHEAHLQEVSNLTEELGLLRTKTQAQEKELTETKQQLEGFQAKYEKLETYLRDSIEVTVHASIVKDLERLLLEEVEKGCAEARELRKRLTAVEEDRKGLILERGHLTSSKEALQTRLETAEEKNKSYREEIGLLVKQAEVAMSNEELACQHLAHVIAMAESAAQERDSYMCLAKSLERQNRRVLNTLRKSKIAWEVRGKDEAE